MKQVPVVLRPGSGPREVVTGVTFPPSSLHQAPGWRPELAVWPQRALGRSSRISSSPALRMMSFTGNPPGQLGSRGRGGRREETAPASRQHQLGSGQLLTAPLFQPTIPSSHISFVKYPWELVIPAQNLLAAYLPPTASRIKPQPLAWPVRPCHKAWPLLAP